MNNTLYTDLEKVMLEWYNSKLNEENLVREIANLLDKYDPNRKLPALLRKKNG
jgi:elongation factor P--beta-lysine ligase